jgi:hypothetical protein
MIKDSDFTWGRRCLLTAAVSFRVMSENYRPINSYVSMLMKPVITYFICPFPISCSEPPGNELRLESWVWLFVLLTLVWFQLRIQTEVLIQTFVLITSPNFPCIPYQSCMLSNDTPRSTFSATSHEYHGKILNRKPSSLYSTYIHVHNESNTHTVDTIH